MSKDTEKIYPFSFTDIELKKEICKYMKNVAPDNNAGHINDIMRFYPLVQVGTEELSSRRTDKMLKIVKITLIVAIISLGISLISVLHYFFKL